jgi:hypothetical protein
MNWKDVLHYVGAAGLILLGLIGITGMHIPGVQIDPMTCIVTGLAVFGIGAKADQALKAVAIFIGGTLVYLSLSIGPVHAANLPGPTKAPAPAYPTTRCGFYLGVDGEGSAGAVNGAPPGTISTGGTIGGLGGYACPTATFPWFVEALADWQNLNASNNGFSLTGPFHGEVRAGVQTDLLQLLPQVFPGTGTPAGLPAPTPPVLPPGATTNGPAVNYVYGAMNFDDLSSQFGALTARDWLFSPEFGAGMLVPVKLANGKPVVMDAWAGVELQTNSFCLGQIACPHLGTRWKVGAAAKF